MPSTLRAFTLLFIGAAIAFASNAAPAATSSDILATVNGTPITLQMVQRYAKQRGLPADTLSAEQQQSLMHELINREIIFRDGIKAGLEKNAEIIATLENQRINLIASAMLERIQKSFNITEQDLRREYDARLPELSGTEYKARHILLANEQDARTTIKELDSGADFVITANAKSIGHSDDGGALDWFTPEQMPDTFAASVTALEKGRYTKNPVQTEYGWHIILLEDQRAIAPPPYETIKEQIRTALTGMRLQEYISELRQHAEIKFPQ